MADEWRAYAEFGYPDGISGRVIEVPSRDVEAAKKLAPKHAVNLVFYDAPARDFQSDSGMSVHVNKKRR